MAELKNTITFQGNPLTLVGKEPGVGEPAPDFETLANDMSGVKLSALQGKVCVICSVPSLDTPVCDTEVRKFNEEA
ncbi:MAG: redoxin domain-containing protein, partial [Planctomycetota bacterium]